MSEQQDNIKDLVAIAKQPISEEEKKQRKQLNSLDPVQRWIVAKGIKEGNTRLSGPFLWEQFKEWTTERPRIYVFYKLLRKHLPYKNVLGNPLYCLDPTPFEGKAEYNAELVKLQLKKDRHRAYNYKKRHQDNGTEGL